MCNAISINIEKRLSIFSIVFITISLVLMVLLFIYQAGFDYNSFQMLNDRKLIITNFFAESLSLIDIISTLFIIVLITLELVFNISNFDAYFICIYKKSKYYLIKIISYLIIVFFYITFIFLSLSIIYMVRFEESRLIYFIFNTYCSYLLYLLYLFYLSYFILQVFNNYFSTILIFILYWVTKLLSDFDFINYIFVSVSVDYVHFKTSFSTNGIYLIIYLLIIFFLSYKLYLDSDLYIST